MTRPVEIRVSVGRERPNFNMETHQIAQLLSETLCHEGDVVHTATEALDRFSLSPDFPFSLLSIATGGDSQGLRIAAATYLKNFTRRNIDGDNSSSKVSKEFKEWFMRALLEAEPPVLKVLVEAFRVIVVSEFVKKNSWPELVPELRSVILNSNFIHQGPNRKWNTVNALTVLHAVLRPFQYFLNPKVAKEPVPPQLELITEEILVPLLTLFHQLVEKASANRGRIEMEAEKILLITCKCTYFAVRSHMPSSLPPLLPRFCRALFGILGSLSFDGTVALDDEYLLRLKTGKRSLLIFCALITRHRKYSDKLMPDIINCVLNIVKFSIYISRLDFPSERVMSLAFDVVSRVLETGPGWRLVSPHFSSLLDSAIFPALVMNEKDILEWEEDADEYIRKNLPSDIEERSGWQEDLFTARKSAMNLLGVISMSKGPPAVSLSYSSAASKRKKSEKKKGKAQGYSVGELLVLPFLSKFPIPSDSTASQTRIINEYYGVLMAYGTLQDLLREVKPEYTTNLLRTRVLPLYAVSECIPYLLATANWVLGELSSCLPEDMSAVLYSSLVKGLVIPNKEDISSYPVRASSAGAITGLLENDYLPPEWLPLIQVVVGGIGDDDEESSMLYQLLSSVMEAGSQSVAVHIPDIVTSLASKIRKRIPPSPEPWPQVVEKGFATLAVMAQTWEDSMPEENEYNELSEEQASGRAVIGRAFSVLMQQAWISTVHHMVLPPPSCIDDSSKLLQSVMRSVTGNNVLLELKVPELLFIWSYLIAEWHAWEESEDLAIFDCIKEVVSLNTKFGLKNFIEGRMPLPPAPPIPQRSIIEGIGEFVGEAISQYPSATWRACSCVHVLLHVPSYSFGTESVKQSLVSTFSQAAFSRFREIQIEPCSMWKPLVLTIASCYLCYSDLVDGILEKDEDKGFSVWASALGVISSDSFKPALSTESEIKLAVMALAKVVERLIGLRNSDGTVLRECFTSLMEASVRLKEAQEEEEVDDDAEEAEEEEEEEDDDDDPTEYEDEDSDDDELEETEEEFLDRYAKAAVALENGTVIEEGDVEDQEQDLELGCLEEVDQERVVWSLIERNRQVLINLQALPVQLISSFLNTFPGYSVFFQQSR